MNRCLLMAIGVCVILTGSTLADDKPTKEPESYARIELKGTLVEITQEAIRHSFGGLGSSARLPPPGFYVYGPGDRQPLGSLGPSWELDLGDNKELREVSKKLTGKGVKVRGDVRTVVDGGGFTLPVRRLVLKVATLEDVEDKK